MPIEPPGREDRYVFDPESGAEMARLINQDRLITQRMGGVFPPDVNPSQLHKVLDLACGPGGWVLDAAYVYPKMEPIGVDISQAMVKYAQARARTQGLNNATFQVMNILKPFDFDDDSFDFVNARLLGAFMSPGDWPGFLNECKRVLRPGGILRLTEGNDLGLSNSAALEQITSLGMEAFRKTGRTFFPYGRFLGTMFMLGRFLRSNDFQDIHQQAYVIDWAADTDVYATMYGDAMVALSLFRPFLLSTGRITAEQFDALYQQALVEMKSPDFVASMLFLSAWGKVNK